MGKYFEQLLFFILEKDSRYEIILKNYQIKEENLTIGELDLIVKDTQTNKLEHWEICLKYYLQSSQTSTHSAMLGPDAKDNLARKIKKLTEHQMTLSSHPQILSIINFQPIDIKLFIKGQFFYHFNKKKTPPNYANPDHECGWWCRNNEIDKKITSDFKWCVLEKPNWIGANSFSNSDFLKTSIEMTTHLNRHFSDKKSSILVAGLNLKDGIWSETTRGFIVEEGWSFNYAPDN